MKLIFEVDLPIDKPTFHDTPDPDEAIKSVADSIRRAFERTRILIARPIGAPFSIYEQTPWAEHVNPVARLIGVSCD